jgi:hypothetical protein
MSDHTARSSKPFCAFHDAASRHTTIAVDIGYSSKSKSCGLAWDGQKEARCLRFGDCIREVAELCLRFEEPLLVVEAPLSIFHRMDGNPGIRGEFEKGRGWYWGPGAVALVAAMRLLRMLGKQLPADKPVLLAEAFLSNKPNRTSHIDDASRIVDEFWLRNNEPLWEGVEPASDLISEIPCVRVFPTGVAR